MVIKLAMNGGVKRIRTSDLNNVNVALYQLSYNSELFDDFLKKLLDLSLTFKKAEQDYINRTY